MSDSPAKKLDFGAIDKENVPYNANTPIVEEPVPIKIDAKKLEVAPKPISIADTIKEMEADEPLLQANPNRFVLFPIKYHEVSRVDASRVKYFTKHNV